MKISVETHDGAFLPPVDVQTNGELHGEVAALKSALQHTQRESSGCGGLRRACQPCRSAQQIVGRFVGCVHLLCSESLDSVTQDLTTQLVAVTKGEQECTELMKQRTALEQQLADAIQTARDVKDANDGVLTPLLRGRVIRLPATGICSKRSLRVMLPSGVPLHLHPFANTLSFEVKRCLP